MNKLTLQEKSQTAKALLDDIRALHTPGETVRFMEVCGTHTVAIFREGLRQVLPEGIELVSGRAARFALPTSLIWTKPWRIPR